MLELQESMSMLSLSSAGDRTKGFMCDACVLDIYYILKTFSEALSRILLPTFKSMCGVGIWSCGSIFMPGSGTLSSQALCHSFKAYLSTTVLGRSDWLLPV